MLRIILEIVIKKNMKKIFIILLLITTIFGGVYFYMKNEKRILKGFACEMVDDTIKTEDIINKYLLCDKRAVALTLMQLEYTRNEYKQTQSKKIAIYSYKDAVNKKKIKDQIVSDVYDNIYIIFLNDKIKIPILLNNNSKIIAISTLNKGGTRFLMRIDGENE